MDKQCAEYGKSSLEDHAGEIALIHWQTLAQGELCTVTTDIDQNLTSADVLNCFGGVCDSWL